MPRGPKGEKRPADVIGNAVHVMKILTGEIEVKANITKYAATLGKRGGHARAAKMTPEQRSEVARLAAAEEGRLSGKGRCHARPQCARVAKS